MLTHEQVWRGIDRLALRNELSPSGLAKRAGLDPTTFNKSKRTTKEGKLRWPSTESLAKILEATRSSMSEFVRLIENDDDAAGAIAVVSRLRFIRWADLQDQDTTDAAGFPVGAVWEEIDFPLVNDSHAYVVELDRDVALPAYRSGDLVVVSPSSGIRRGDRVVGRLRDGTLVLGVMIRRTAHRVTIDPADWRADELAVEARQIAWLSRVVWLSQ